MVAPAIAVGDEACVSRDAADTLVLSEQGNVATLDESLETL